MRWPLQPLQSFQQTQLQPPFGQSVDSLCHPWFTTTKVSYRFPILKLPPPPCAVLLVYTHDVPGLQFHGEMTINNAPWVDHGPTAHCCFNFGGDTPWSSWAWTKEQHWWLWGRISGCHDVRYLQSLPDISWNFVKIYGWSPHILLAKTMVSYRSWWSHRQVVELQATFIEENLLKQVSVLMPGMAFPVWAGI